MVNDIKQIMFILLLGAIFSTNAIAENSSLEGIIPYKPIVKKENVYGIIKCRGSTTVGSLLDIWAAKFQSFYPNIKSSLIFKGSSDGFKALIDDTANIGASSRPIKKSEIEEFRAVKGYVPTEIKVSLDALAIYVNRLNSLKHITFEELDAIFSENRKRAYPKAIKNWKQLTNKEGNMSIYMFNSDSGSRAYFKNIVLQKGNYTDNIVSDEYMLLPEVVDEVANDINGITFGSIGTKNFKVKMVPVAKQKQFPYYRPTTKNIKMGKYSLTRFLYLYIDVPPDRPIPKFLYEFCKFVLSLDGQSILERENKIALSPKIIGIELLKLKREE